MHILVIPSWYPRVVDDVNGSFFREQAIALAKRKCTVGVISLQLCLLQNLYSGLFVSRKIRCEIDEGVNTYRMNGIKWFPLMPRAAAWYWRFFGLRLFDEYVKRHGEPDVIHVQSMINAGVVAEAIHKRTRIPYIITEHSTAFTRGLLTKTQISILESVTRSASRRFAVSHSLGVFLRRNLECNFGVWDVMPNIVQEKFLTFPIRADKGQGYSFISIALLTKKKCVDVLIEAFAKAFGGNTEVRLYLGGDGAERKSLEKLAKYLGVVDQVIFLGMLSREDVVKHIAAANALLLFSRHETFGVVIVEALALGKPVVATKCGGPEDIVREGDGVLVPVDDQKAMVAAMLDIYKGRNDYDPKSIREACRARYSEEVITARLMAVFRKIISSNNAAQLNSL